MIRGCNKAAKTAAVAECKDILEVVARGTRTFRAFQQRNPWIFGDSVQGCAYVLLDPETATLSRVPHGTPDHAFDEGEQQR
jgi:hypothetical protein